MSSRHDAQRLTPGTLVELFEVDYTNLGGIVEYFHSGSTLGRAPVVWKTKTYMPWAMSAQGFEYSGKGQWPTPTVTVSNFGGEMTVRCMGYHDLVGAKLTRRRVYARYLDGQPAADPNAGFPDDIYTIERKTAESREAVTWQLSTPMDVEGVLIPLRQVLLTCQSEYRSSECSYAGPPVAKIDDTPTTDPTLDRCSHRISGCQMRFGVNGPLPFGGCPGAARR
jgi:lambda family phage minor tail protein L